jgi:TetR/AcrR family transcriptional regulator
MLYHYFGNKEALFAAAMESAFAQARPQVIPPCPPAEDPVTALRDLTEGMFAYFERGTRTTILVNSSNLHGSRHLQNSPAFRSILEERVARMTAILEHGRRTGVFRDDVDPTLLTLTVTAMIVYFFANNATLSVFLDDDLKRPAARAAWREHVTDFLTRIVARP